MFNLCDIKSLITVAGKSNSNTREVIRETSHLSVRPAMILEEQK